MLLRSFAASPAKPGECGQGVGGEEDGLDFCTFGTIPTNIVLLREAKGGGRSYNNGRKILVTEGRF